MFPGEIMMSACFSALFRMLLVFVLALGAARAGAGIHVEDYTVSWFGNPTPILYTDTFSDGDPFANPGAPYTSLVRSGMLKDKDEDAGILSLRPWRRGDVVMLGGYTLLAQIIEVQTPLTGPGALTNTSFYQTFAVFELESIMRDDTWGGIGLTNVYQGGDRAVVAAIGRRGGERFAKFSNPLTGEILDEHPLTPPSGSVYFEMFLNLEFPGSTNVLAGYAYRNSARALIGGIFFFEPYEMYSDVVLRPVLFAAAPVPEPETWALLILGLALVGVRTQRVLQRRRSLRLD